MKGDTKFCIDMMPTDRDGITGLAYEHKLFGVSADPLATASEWLIHNRGAKPGDGIELRMNGAARVYTLIAKADNNDSAPVDYPDDNSGDDEGDDAPHNPPKKGKKKAKPVEDQPAEKDPSEPGKPDRPRDSSPDRREASYQSRVRDTAAAIIAAGHKRRGTAPQPLSAAGRIFESNCRVLDAEIAAGMKVRPSAAMIINAGRKARGLPLLGETNV